jgi:D-serine deaminase-like pyridoxal phosphate-dependent protein
MPGVTPVYAPGWDQPMYQHGASSMAWASVGSGEWVIPAGTTYGDATSSSSGLRSSSHGATLTQQMSELNIRVGDMEETVHQHVESTQDW